VGLRAIGERDIYLGSTGREINGQSWRLVHGSAQII
jgi:hypothetical protein